MATFTILAVGQEVLLFQAEGIQLANTSEDCHEYTEIHSTIKPTAVIRSTMKHRAENARHQLTASNKKGQAPSKSDI
jgi:hypothetical protein